VRTTATRIVERYALYEEISSGGMASVRYGRVLGAPSTSSVVAIKSMHPHLANDPEWVKMFLDEARVVSRVRHENVIRTLDVVTTDGELLIVMEYVAGETLSRLMGALNKKGGRMPPRIACAIVAEVCHGLHAAHEAKGADGQPLGIVHRDVSPRNVLVGADGTPRLLDFGLARATGQLHQSVSGEIKGTLAYMAPEQIRGEPATRKVDVYAASVLLWEAVTGRRLFQADNEAALLAAVMHGTVERASASREGVPPQLDRILERGLAADPAKRFPTARQMGLALDGCVGGSIEKEIAAWVLANAGPALATRAARVAEIEEEGLSESLPITRSPGVSAARNEHWETVRPLERIDQPWDDSETQVMGHAPVHVPSSGSMATAPRASPGPAGEEESTLTVQSTGPLPQAIQRDPEVPTLISPGAPLAGHAPPLLPEAEDPTPFSRAESPTLIEPLGALVVPLQPYVPPPFVPPAYPALNPRTAATVKRRMPWQLRIALICGVAGGFMFIVFAVALLARALFR
jgi:serine/threonine protein kinase